METRKSPRRNTALLAAMGRRDLSQVALAAVAGLSQRTVNQLVVQRIRPTQATAKAIAKALGCPVATLFTDFANRGGRR